MLEIGFVLVTGFRIMSLSAALVFEGANEQARETIYKLHFLSETGGPVLSSSGMMVQTQPFGDALFDTVIVVGGDEIMPIPAGLADYLRRMAKDARRIGSTCTGTLLLADAGVLNGLHAATHWFLADEFRARYPAVKLAENKTFVVDGSVWTSAGMTAGMTQALAMVEKDIGAALAQSVSKNLIVRPWHDASQQASPMLDLTARTERIQKAIAYAQRNLHKDLSIDELACAAHLSPRQFSRAFKAETGLSPAKAVEKLRLEAARQMVQSARHSIEIVAERTGFGRAERMRRAFIRAYGTPPQVVRRSYKSEVGWPPDYCAASDDGHRLRRVPAD